jgi:hypothetical protein
MELLKALAASNSSSKLIVVLIHGRPVTFGGAEPLPSASGEPGFPGLPGRKSDAFYLGCFGDGNGAGKPGPRLLPVFGPGAGNNIGNWTGFDDCLRFCHSKGHVYAGVEDGHECYCGDAAPSPTRKDANESLCSKPCAPSSATGEPSRSNYTCGGAWWMDVYNASHPLPPAPPTHPNVKDPLARNFLLSRVDALFAAWRPGEEGGTAVANLLFGDVNPSGKLTQAWVASGSDVHGPGNPWFQPYEADGGTKSNTNRDDDSSVLFPFGFGLSYASFKYSRPTLSAPSATANSSFEVSVTVLNTANIAGATVVQIYAGGSAGMTPGITRNERVLVGYSKVSLGAGQKAVATVKVQTNDLGRYEPYLRQWLVDLGNYTIFAQDCAGSRWDGYLQDVQPIPNPPLLASSSALPSPSSLLHKEEQPSGLSSKGPTWQGGGCTVMGSSVLTIMADDQQP